MNRKAQKKFITNLMILLSLNLLIKPFWILGIDRTVQNISGAQEYGFYFAVFNFSFLFNIILDLGITNFNNKNIAQNDQLLNKHFSGIIVLRLLLAVLYLIITMSAGFIIGYDSRQIFILLFLAFNQFLITLILYLRSNISALHFFKTDSIISVLDRLFMILICSALLWGNFFTTPFRIEWYIYAQTAAYLITAVIAFFIVVKKAEFTVPNWNIPFFLMIIRKSMPFAVLILLMTFYNRIDSVMIERILRNEDGFMQAGIYASAYRLLDATNMIAYLFSVILLPLFARMIKKKESVEKLVKISFTILITGAIIIGIASNFYSFELMELLYHDHISESSQVFSLLMLGFIAISTTYVFGTLLTANGNLKYLNIIASSGMIINIVLNIVLIPHFKAVGSAYASLITQFLTAILQVLIVQKIFKFNFKTNFLLKLIGFTLGVIIINHFSKLTGFHWHFNFLIMVSACLLLAFGLKLLNLKSLLLVMKKEG